MQKIKIITDTTADLTKELYDQCDCEVLPLHVHIDGKDYLDTYEISTKELYEIMDKTKLLPKTSAISPEKFIETFKKLKAEGYDGAIVTGIGSQLSSTMQSAKIALNEYSELDVKIVDSRNLSTGTGLLIMYGRDYLNKGHTLEETANYLEGLVPRVRAQFIVESLDIIYRGGRISSAKYLFGKMLKAHPFIQVKLDKLAVAATPKGKIKKALDFQYDVFLKDKEKGILTDHLFITHSEAIDSSNYYLDKIKNDFDISKVKVTGAGAVISSHCGRGTIGILYIMKE